MAAEQGVWEDRYGMEAFASEYVSFWSSNRNMSS